MDVSIVAAVVAVIQVVLNYSLNRILTNLQCSLRHDVTKCSCIPIASSIYSQKCKNNCTIGV